MARDVKVLTIRTPQGTPYTVTVDWDDAVEIGDSWSASVPSCYVRPC